MTFGDACLYSVMGLLVVMTVLPLVFMFASYLLYQKHYRLDEDEYARICGEIAAKKKAN